MIVLRVYKGVAEHFPIRRSEWIMLIPTFGMWIAFQVAPNMFSASKSFAKMAGWADEQTWATIVLACGVVRLAALTINGTFRRFRLSPHMRMAASLVCLLFWSQWTLCVVNAYFTANGVPSGIVAYLTFCAFELSNVRIAAKDIGGEIRRIADDDGRV